METEVIFPVQVINQRRDKGTRLNFRKYRKTETKIGGESNDPGDPRSHDITVKCLNNDKYEKNMFTPSASPDNEKNAYCLRQG